MKCRGVEPRRGAGRRNLGTHVWHCKSLISNIHPARNDTWVVPYNVISLTGYVLYKSQSEGSAPRIVPRAPPTKRARSRTLQQIRTSPTNEKLPHRTPPLQKAKQIIAHVMAGFCGEVLGERGRFGGREPRLSRGGSLPQRSFLTPSALPHSTSSCRDGSRDSDRRCRERM